MTSRSGLLSLFIGALTLSVLASCREDLRQGNGEGGHGGGVASGGKNAGGATGGGGVTGAGGALVPDAGMTGGAPDAPASGGAVGNGGATTASGGGGAAGTTANGGSTPSGGAAGTASSFGGRIGQGGALGPGGSMTATGGKGSGGAGGKPATGSGGSNSLLALGEACTAAAACGSGICADGVCCNATCSGQCEACNITGSKGTCTAVTTPRTACAGSGTCAGHCDGTSRAACVYPGTTVSCGGAASCTNSKAMTAALCSGTGTCTAPATTNCTYGCRSDGPTCDTKCPSGQALCGGSSCVDTLSTAAHCGDSCTPCQGSTTKCLSGACVQCVNGNDCGAGQVCTTSHVCKCRPQSSSNILLNPNFDASVGGGLGNWAPSSPQATTFTTDDADGCSGSGSVHVAFAVWNSGMNKDFGNVTQCAPAASNTAYYFGYKFKQEPAEDGETNLCELWFYTGTSCTGSAINFDSVQVPSGLSGTISNWTGQSTTIQTPAGTGRVQITCHMSGLGSGSFDQIYLNSVANSY